MIGLLQRAKWARVSVGGQVIASIGPGLLVLVGVERGDQAPAAERLAERLLAYRVFPDGDGRMNRSLTDVAGELLLVPQFTLAADTRHGNRPGFEPAAPPAEGRAGGGPLRGRAAGGQRQGESHKEGSSGHFQRVSTHNSAQKWLT